MAELIEWDMYEVSSEKHPLTGNMVRGRLRKFCLGRSINVLVENTQDKEARIRFAVISGTDISLIKEFFKNLFNDVLIKRVFEKIKNPILAKIKCNIEERYTI